MVVNYKHMIPGLDIKIYNIYFLYDLILPNNQITLRKSVKEGKEKSVGEVFS